MYLSSIFPVYAPDLRRRAYERLEVEGVLNGSLKRNLVVHVPALILWEQWSFRRRASVGKQHNATDICIAANSMLARQSELYFAGYRWDLANFLITDRNGILISNKNCRTTQKSETLVIKLNTASAV